MKSLNAGLQKHILLGYGLVICLMIGFRCFHTFDQRESHQDNDAMAATIQSISLLDRLETSLHHSDSALTRFTASGDVEAQKAHQFYEAEIRKSLEGFRPAREHGNNHLQTHILETLQRQNKAMRTSQSQNQNPHTLSVPVLMTAETERLVEDEKMQQLARLDRFNRQIEDETSQSQLLSLLGDGIILLLLMSLFVLSHTEKQRLDHENTSLAAKTEEQSVELQKTYAEFESQHLLLQIVGTMNDSLDDDEFFQHALNLICRHLKWPVGHVYTWGEKGKALIPTNLWYLKPYDRFQTFRDVTMETSVALGCGLAGRVAESRRLLWISDVRNDYNFTRIQQNPSITVSTGFAFPVLVKKQVVAVLEFFTDVQTEPSEEQLDVLEQVSIYIGRVVERRQMEEAVVSSQERLKLAMEGTNDGVWDWDLKTDEAYFSPRWLEMLGYSLWDIPNTGVALLELIHPDDQPHFNQELNNHLEGRTPLFEVETRLRTKSGDWKWILSRGKVFSRDEQGKPNRMAGTHTDIQETKLIHAELLEGRERFKAAIDNAPIGMALVSPEGRWLRVNKALCDIVGYTTAEMLTLDFQTITHPDDLELNLENVARMRAHQVETYQMEKRYIHKNGLSVWVQLNVSLVSDAEGNPRYFVAQIQDISERLQMEKDMRKAKEEAMQASQLKSEFLANMSHEIRTPLNGIIGLTHLLLEGDVNARQRDFLQKLHASGEQLLSLVNGILDLSKIEAGKLELRLEPFSIRERMEELVGLFQNAAEIKGLTLEYTLAGNIPDELQGDWMRISQVLNNLIGNAMKFTERGSISIAVSPLWIAPETGGNTDATVELHFQVTDTGIGIAPDKQQMIFEPFTQADGSTIRKYGGTGLGLSVSTQLVRIMGGRLGVESELQRGSTFYFTVPLTRVSKSQPVSEVLIHEMATVHSNPMPLVVPLEGSSQPTRVIRILLAEDNAINQLVAENYLAGSSYQVTMANNGLEAVERLEMASYDIILMDLHMPEMDGFEATRLIRAKEAGTGARIPIIALTADITQGIEEKCLDAGMDRYLLKPFERQELFDMIARSVLQETTDAPSEIEDIPFDREVVMSRLGNSRELLFKIISKFEDVYPDQVRNIEQALSEQQCKSVEEMAHNLKNALGNFSTRGGAFQSALKLEQMGREENLTDSENVYEQLIGGIDALMVCLKKEMQADA